MKNSRPVTPGSGDGTAMRASERPLKICIAFDEDASGRSAEVMIRHMASDYECDTRSFAFGELNPPPQRLEVARNASDADIYVLAVRDDRMLPTQVKSWLGLCIGVRDRDQEGALVLLIAEAGDATRPDSPLISYLETLAVIGGLSFFPRHRSYVHVPAVNDTTITG